jgi:hypothetical protein
MSLPLPAAVRTRLAKVTETALGLFTLICSIGKSVAPGGCVLLAGGLGPTVTEIVGGFGVKVTIGEAETVIVFVTVVVAVMDGIAVTVWVTVGVIEAVGVLVLVAVGGRVPVGLMVIVGVWVGVEVGTEVRVQVLVGVGVRVGV